MPAVVTVQGMDVTQEDLKDVTDTSDSSAAAAAARSGSILRTCSESRGRSRSRRRSKPRKGESFDASRSRSRSRSQSAKQTMWADKVKGMTQSSQKGQKNISNKGTKGEEQPGHRVDPRIQSLEAENRQLRRKLAELEEALNRRQVTNRDEASTNNPWPLDGQPKRKAPNPDRLSDTEEEDEMTEDCESPSTALAPPAKNEDDSPGGSGPQESSDTHEHEASSPRAPSLPEPRLSPLSGAASQEKKKKKKGKNKGTLRNREQPIASADDLADHPKPSEPPACGGVQGDHPTGPRREKRQRFVPFVAPLQPQVTDDDLRPREYTVLYRPVARRSHFLAASGDAIAAFLSGVPGVHRVRPNLRRNVVAVDTLPGEDLTALLAVRVICDVRVRATALILNTCTGTLFDVDPTFDGATIFEGLESSVPVVAIARSGDVVTLRFAGDVVPEEVLLFRRRRAVRPRLPRPLQCGRCGLFGHATVTCSRDPRCLQCAGGHPTNSCTVDRRRCLHCGGPHAATEPRCPQWQLERRVAATLASSKPRITRKQALELARSSGAAVIDSSKQRPAGQRATESRPLSSRRQPGLSYSAALTGGTQADSSISGGVGEPPVTDNNPVQPPGATAPVTSVLVLTALASALRSLLELAPADSPARHMCVAALAMHDALVQHGYATSCQQASCTASPCVDPSHPAGRSRASVYVRAGLAQAEVNVCDLPCANVECVAVTVRVGATDTCVASVYVRSGRRWDTEFVPPV
ncbi:hypothetical protein HPB49_004244 [Dermacentor silvarum]|uniref:Uncharacterized protein n=1 Tax=Dermacentor silvarum TaxID=543639 RepID=A0ACB8CPL1_DERSI|nr:hypothetical protein HPB49_004244 [Dermacentor silvarum]